MPAINDALLSACGTWRWRLERHIGAGDISPAVFGVNPSTADAALDDATVRKWRGFGQRLGWSRFVVGNLFSFRATDVRALAVAADPFGPDHMTHIRRIIDEADILIPCWGNRAKMPKGLRPEADRMMRLLVESGKPIRCWGQTRSGDPCHPLMLGYDTRLVDLAA